MKFPFEIILNQKKKYTDLKKSNDYRWYVKAYRSIYIGLYIV